MLLRSFSTPVLGSLILADGKGIQFSEKASQVVNQNSVCYSGANSASDRLVRLKNEDVFVKVRSSGIRRTRSEADLRRGSLSYASANMELFNDGFDFSSDDFQHVSEEKAFLRRTLSRKRMDSLKSLPSFSLYCQNSFHDRDGIANHTGSGDFQFMDFSFRNHSIVEMDETVAFDEEKRRAFQAPLFFPLGEMGASSGGTGNSHSERAFREGNSGANSPKLDQYYESKLEVGSENALLLGDYAQYLHEVKKDPYNAEKFYSQAITAQPDNGEVLARYAKVVWEYKHDRSKAAALFEAAVEMSPGNCDVVAAHASFLWSTDEEEDLGDFLPTADGSMQKYNTSLMGGGEEYFAAAQAHGLSDTVEDEEAELQNCFVLAEKAYALWNSDEQKPYSTFISSSNVCGATA